MALMMLFCVSAYAETTEAAAATAAPEAAALTQITFDESAAPYQGSWLTFDEDGFGVYLPSDWVKKDVTDEMKSAGTLYAGTSADGAYAMTLSYAESADVATNDDLASQLTTAGYQNVTALNINGIDVVGYDIDAQDVSGVAFLDGNGGMPVRSNAQVAAGLKRQIRVETTRPFDSYAITKNAKYPDRIFALLDWALSDEGQILLQSGVEGTHYTLVDGKRTPTDAYINGVLTNPNYNTDEGFDLASFFGACKQGDDQGIAFNLQAAPVYYDEIFLSDRQKEAYKNLGWSNSLEYWTKTGELAPTGLAATCILDPDSDEGKLDEKFKAWIAVAATKLVAAEDFDATWAELNKEYEAMGVDSIVNKYNEILATNQERYNQYVTNP